MTPTSCAQSLTNDSLSLTKLESPISIPVLYDIKGVFDIKDTYVVSNYVKKTVFGMGFIVHTRSSSRP
jgi:hypothetical protein